MCVVHFNVRFSLGLDDLCMKEECIRDTSNLLVVNTKQSRPYLLIGLEYWPLLTGN